jgi:hypothetical protein
MAAPAPRAETPEHKELGEVYPIESIVMLRPMRQATIQSR